MAASSQALHNLIRQGSATILQASSSLAYAAAQPSTRHLHGPSAGATGDAGPSDLTIGDLNVLALAVVAEQSRRLNDLDLPVLLEPVDEPPPAPLEPAETGFFTTQFGRVWHRTRRCPHLQGRRVIVHAESPLNRRPCKTCRPLNQ